MDWGKNLIQLQYYFTFLISDLMEIALCQFLEAFPRFKLVLTLKPERLKPKSGNPLIVCHFAS